MQAAPSFDRAPDYEGTTDADGNNVYLVQVTASDGGRKLTARPFEPVSHP